MFQVYDCRFHRANVSYTSLCPTEEQQSTYLTSFLLFYSSTYQPSMVNIIQVHKECVAILKQVWLIFFKNIVSVFTDITQRLNIDSSDGYFFVSYFSRVSCSVHLHRWVCQQFCSQKREEGLLTKLTLRIFFLAAICYLSQLSISQCRDFYKTMHSCYFTKEDDSDSEVLRELQFLTLSFPSYPKHLHITSDTKLFGFFFNPTCIFCGNLTELLVLFSLTPNFILQYQVSRYLCK